MPQTAIPCLLMRGGTSKGPFFQASDLPADTATRDKVLLAAMGSPDKRQIDGLGGAHPLTSKVGIVSLSTRAGIDLEFLFAQLQPDKDTVDTTPNCGNMLAAVVPFALETGMLMAQGDTSTFRVLTLNTDMACDITVQTPGGQVDYDGSARIDGAPGSSAPITINFLDTAGSVCSGLLPTGQVRDTITVTGAGFVPFTLDVTCIDNGMPLVIFKAEDMGRTGYESVAGLNADTELKTRVEALRLAASLKMGLGDVSQKNYPKMTLIAPPQHGGAVSTRSFIPHVCHDAIGVLAAVTVGTACVLEGSVCDGVAVVPPGSPKKVSVEHPTGEFSVSLTTGPANPEAAGRSLASEPPSGGGLGEPSPGGPQVRVTEAALLRTARALMRGEVLVPASIWKGRQA
jgi:4-oxalomesaconate tautomerase